MRSAFAWPRRLPRGEAGGTGGHQPQTISTAHNPRRLPVMPCHQDGRRRAGPQSRADCPRHGMHERTFHPEGGAA
jgi:hypothetical protein